MSEYSLTEIVTYAVEELTWPFYNPDLLKKFQTLAIFTGIYGIAFVCNVQHWITGISNSDRSLDMAINTKTRMNPVDVLSFAVIVVGVAARSLIILNLVYVFFLLKMEVLAQAAGQSLMCDMKDKKKRSGREFQKRDSFNLCRYLKAERWAQDQLGEQAPALLELLAEIYERLGMRHVGAYLLPGNIVLISGIRFIIPYQRVEG